MSPEYKEAYDKHSDILIAFRSITDRYRAGEISDEEYLEARAEKETADREFDIAYAAEEERAEREANYVELVPNDGQGSLL